MASKAVVFALLVAFCLSAMGFSLFGTSRRDAEVQRLPADTMYLDSTHGDGTQVINENGQTYTVNENGERVLQTGLGYFRSSTERSGSQGSVRSRDLEGHHNSLSSLGYDGTPFSFTLKEPLFHEISREAAIHYMEPGWTINDSHNREVDVRIDIPVGMRRQVPGLYDITYKAYLRDGSSLEPLGIQKRQVRVFDIDQCQDGTHDCSQHAYCIKLESGGFRCECHPGFRGTGKICQDINECAEGLAVCDIHATCVNTLGSYECVCKQGFKKIGDVCEDINECALSTHDCSPNAHCTNLPGSYQCKCKEGFEGNGKVCTPINKCRSGEINCHPYASCLVLPNGEFKCECREGFRGDGIVTCEDINECEDNFFTCPEHSHCRNTFGSYNCICDPGFHEVNKVCEDIDECAMGTHDCGPHADCFNTIGGYNCFCKDGYVKSTDGRCESATGNPEVTLKGANPMSIDQFTTYSEPGFLLEEEREEMSLVVRIPPQLHGTARQCGHYEITYHAKDFGTGKETVRTRHVNVNEINQCALPEDHPYSDNCHPYAQCIHLTGQCDYTCQCPPGHQGNGFGPDGCKDSVPPVFAYNGPEPFIREVCRVCGTVLAEPDLSEPVITKAYDNTPLGPKDVSDRIVLTTEPSEQEDCIVHHYTVADDSGNVASRRLTVCLRIEDMRTTIMEMKAMYSWQVWIIRNVAFLCALAFLLFCVWEFGHYISACFRVLTSDDASYDDKDAAYSLWYRITNPLASRATIRQLVHRKTILEDEATVEDEYDDVYGEDESDEDYSSGEER